MHVIHFWKDIIIRMNNWAGNKLVGVAIRNYGRPKYLKGAVSEKIAKISFNTLIYAD